MAAGASGSRTAKVRFTGDTTGLTRAAKDGERAVSGWAKAVGRAAAAGARVAQAGAVAIGAAIAGGIAAGLQQSKANALLVAQLGASADQARKLGEVSGKLLGRGVVDGIESANAAIGAAIQQGLVVPDAALGEIDAVSTRVANLAIVLQDEASKVAAAVATMLKTGIAKNATEAFDVIQRGAELGLNKSQDLLDSFVEYSTLFRGLGLSAKQATGLLNQGLQAGARNADQVSDALKEFQLRAIDGSKLTAEGFKALGLNAKTAASNIGAGGNRAAKQLDQVLDRLRKIEDPVKRNAAAVALFGTKAEDLAGALFALDLTTATKAMDGFEGAADRAGKTLEESAGAQVTAFKNKLQSELITRLAAAVTWIDRNREAAKALAVTLGTVAAVLVTVKAATTAFEAAQAVAKAATVAWTAVTWLLNTALWAQVAALLANPITWIVIGVIATIAAVAALIIYWDELSAMLQGIGRWFVEVFWRQWLKGAFDAIGRAIAGVGKWFSDMQAKVISVFVNIGKSITSPFITAFNKVSSAWNATIGRLSWTIPGWVPEIGGKTISAPRLPQVGFLAEGGTARARRPYVIGEDGPELMWPGRTGRVTSNDDSRALLAEAGGGGDVYLDVHLDALSGAVRVERVAANKRTARYVKATRARAAA